MQKRAISVEANLIEKRARLRSEKRVTYKDDTMPSTSSRDSKMENLVRTMEIMMERISMNERTPHRDNQKNPQNRNWNQNFRRDSPKKKPREVINKSDHPSKITMLMKGKEILNN